MCVHVHCVCIQPSQSQPQSNDQPHTPIRQPPAIASSCSRKRERGGGERERERERERAASLYHCTYNTLNYKYEAIIIITNNAPLEPHICSYNTRSNSRKTYIQPYAHSNLYFSFIFPSTLSYGIHFHSPSHHYFFHSLI